MKKQSLLAILLLISISIVSHAQKKYEQVWAALNSNDHSKAQTYIQEANGDGEKRGDNYITNIYLKSYSGKQMQITDFDNAFYDQVSNPYPYIYALWFNDALLGQYGKKHYEHQLRLIDKILADPKAHGTLVASSHYQKGLHHSFSSNFEQASKEFAQVGNLRNWQYVGPFENLSHSGFYKNYGPPDHPDGKTEFVSSTNAKVKWFSPAVEMQDGWNPVIFQFNTQTAVVYAQTFINSPRDQEVFCNAGTVGAIKVWINDAPVLSEYTERVTEMDTYTAKCKLQKGVNRVLVQLSFTNASYGNFSVRITDENFRAIPGITGSNVYKPYSKASAATAAIPVKHFAESFFQDKIQHEPSNLVNYLLLADVYMRNKKTLEARNLLETALQQEPNNNLLRKKLIEILDKENNRSVLLEEVAKLRKNDPTSLVALDIDIQNAMSNERLTEAREKLKQREALYGEDFTTFGYELNFLMREKKINDFIALAEKNYKKYEDAPNMVRIMYSIRKEVNRDPVGALKVYEDYLKNNFNADVNREYIKMLQENGQADKSLERRKFIAETFPYDPALFSEMATYHSTAKEYGLAEENVMKALQRSPYNEYYWEQLGDIKRDQNKSAESIDAYNKSLLFDPNQYDVINKLRILKGRSESYQLVPAVNVDEVISRDNPAEAIISDRGYYIILEEKSAVMHPGGAVEEYNTFIVRVTNENGINEFKESNIGYGRGQNLLIEQSEVVKPSGAKIKGERNDNSIVFTNLEAGDVIVFRYRMQNFHYGRFGRDFYNQHFFEKGVYIAKSKFTLLAPPAQKINYVFTHSTVKPVITNVEDLKQYSWEVVKQAPLKEESFMPAWVDVVPVLHVSTIAQWNDIARWYADMINNSSEESYELTTVFEKLFPKDEHVALNQFEKARRIYNFIQQNIRYSSVSFRQSAYLPQSATITLSTRLGDCKDLSNLFMTLCRMAKIESRMVLVDTRENGMRDMILPSLNFNHCITKASLDGKEYYVELTDNYLPFASLPNNLPNALILEIPKKGETQTVELKPLIASTKTNDITTASISLKLEGSDLVVNVASSKYGNLTSSVRSSYLNVPYEKQLKTLEESCASTYKNVIMDTVSFSDLSKLEDSLSMQYTFRLKDEIMEIGSLRTFKLPFIDVVATLNKFSANTRTYPLDYNGYENTDTYDTRIIVEIPSGKKLVETPANESFSFGKMTYSLSYKLAAPGKLEVIRKFTSNRNEIPAKDYMDFRSFVERIVKAEQKMIAFQ